MKVVVRPEMSCVVEQVSIDLYEVPVTMIDNRTNEEVDMVFFITVDPNEPYALEKKVDEICKHLGYMKVSISPEKLFQTFEFDAGVTFNNLYQKQFSK